MRRSCLALLLVMASCSGAPKKGGTKPKTHGVKTARKIGSGCTPSQKSMQGDCPGDLLCMPVKPGTGACTKFCPANGDCGKGAACVETGRAGELCEMSCKVDADCAGVSGFICDPAWKTCAPSNLNAPKAPVCEGAADLPRKTFGPPQQISTNKAPGYYQFEPAAAVGAKGEVTAVYITHPKDMAGANSLGVSQVMPDLSVDGDRELKSDRENHFDPWLAADRKGKLYAVWLGFDGGHAPEKRMQIGLSTSPDGKAWTPTVVANDTKTDCPDEAPGCLDKPMIAIGPDKNDVKRDAIYVFYFSAVAEKMKMTKSTDGGATFGASVEVGDGGYGDAEVSPDGNIDAVYVTGEGAAFGDDKNHVDYVYSTDGGATFAKAVTVSGEGEAVPFFFSNPQVVTDAKRKLIYVVYPAGGPDAKWDIMLATSRDGGATWTRIKANDDPSCANHMTPAMALDPKTGKVHLAWTEDRGGAGRIVYAACDSGGAKCGANEAVSDEPFASYSFVRHSPKWQGEYNSLLIDSKRKAIHMVWTQTVDEGAGAVARIFEASGKLK